MQLRDDEAEGDYIKCDACGKDAMCNAWGVELCMDCKEEWWASVVMAIHKEADDFRVKLLKERTPKWAAEKRKAAA